MKKAIGTIGILLSLLTLSLEIYALPLLQYTEAAGAPATVPVAEHLSGPYSGRR